MAKKILVIDDDPQTVDYLVALFNDNGYQTCAAKDAAQAFEVMKSEKPDLMTLDLDMPEIAGPLFYIRVSKMDEFKNIPVVVISGLHVPHRAIKKAVASFTKPFDRKELLTVVAKVIGPSTPM
ncbi:MAG: response regulator [Desulfobacteraceae bacterium]|nr:MAG: response regulator [Desulfobacteraceae bacterium]